MAVILFVVFCLATASAAHSSAFLQTRALLHARTSGGACTAPNSGQAGQCASIDACNSGGGVFVNDALFETPVCGDGHVCCTGLTSTKFPRLTTSFPRFPAPGLGGEPNKAITADKLSQLCPSFPKAKINEMLPHLNAAMKEGKISDNCRRIKMFLAQVLHESGCFIYFQELASGAAYEGRRDLGNTQPGDGRRFKGRGPIQLTGRANYAAASKALGLGDKLVQNPEIVATYPYGFRTTVWYWTSRNLNAKCDNNDFLGLTKAINGGTNGLADRQQYLAKAERIINNCAGMPENTATAPTGDNGGNAGANAGVNAGSSPEATGEFPLIAKPGCDIHKLCKCLVLGTQGFNCFAMNKCEPGSGISNGGQLLAFLSVHTVCQPGSRASQGEVGKFSAAKLAECAKNAKTAADASWCFGRYAGNVQDTRVQCAKGDQKCFAQQQMQYMQAGKAAEGLATPQQQQLAQTSGSPQQGQTNGDLRAKIFSAIQSSRGMSTREGPGGGNVACAWTVNKVLGKAGIRPIGSNPNLVSSVESALKGGRGREVPKAQAQPGDIAVAQDRHIGFCIAAGCARILSNSSSRAAFQWESGPTYDGSYGGGVRVVYYQVLN